MQQRHGTEGGMHVVTHMRKRAIAVVGGVASALLVLGATPAAAETIRCYTSPSNRGHATLDTTYGFMYVDDTYADSRRVVAFAYNASGDAVLAYAYDSNGSNNGSGAGADVDMSRVGMIETCTQRGTDTSTQANCWTTRV